jgi:hypothetical protein
MYNLLNRSPFLSAGIRVQLLGRYISKGIKGVRQSLLLDCAPGKNSDTSHYENRVSQVHMRYSAVNVLIGGTRPFPWHYMPHAPQRVSFWGSS